MMDDELRRLMARDASREPTAEELAAASRPSFRMSSPGGRRTQRGGGEALETLGSAILGSVPAGLAGLASMPFQGVEGAAKTIERVQDYLTIDPKTEGGVRALRGIAGALSPLSAVPQAAGDATLRATGSPLLATGAELLADPLNLLGAGAAAKPIARGAAAAGRGAAAAGRATVENLGPRAAEMAEAYMRRAGMMPDIFIGKSAKTWDAASNARAMEMEKVGANPRDIWSQTGNWRAPDGQWRQEISDAPLQVGPIAPPVTAQDIAKNEKNKQLRDQVRLRMKENEQKNILRVRHGKRPLESSREQFRKLADQDAQLSDQIREFSDRLRGRGGQLYGQVVHHPELLEAYPDLGSVMLRSEPGSRAAGRLSSREDMEVNIPAQSRSITAHESQHWVQGEEDFGLGGNPSMAFAPQNKEAFEILAQKRKEMYTPLTLQEYAKMAWASQEVTPQIERAYKKEYLPLYKNPPPLIERAAQEAAAHEYYRRLLGEAEARATQGRLNLSPAERRARFPLDDYDVPEEQLIVKKGVPGGFSASIPGPRSNVNRMTNDQVEQEIRSLMPRVTQAYESGNVELAQRLDDRLERLMDSLESRHLELEEDMLTKVDLANPNMQHLALQGEMGDAEADLVRDLANRYKELNTPGGIYANEEPAQFLRGALEEFDSRRHGGLKDGITDQQVLDAAKDAYESVYGMRDKQAQRIRQRNEQQLPQAAPPKATPSPQARADVQAQARALGLPATGSTDKMARLVSIAQSNPSKWTKDDFDLIAPHLSVHQDLRPGAQERIDSILSEGLSKGMVDSVGDMASGQRWTWGKGLQGTPAYVFISGDLKYQGQGNPRLAPGNKPLFAIEPGKGQNFYEALQTARQPQKKAQGGPVGGNMSYTQAADVIADKLIRQGMDPDRAFMMALRMSDARMKAGGAVLMADGGDPGEFQYTPEEDAAIEREKRRMLAEQRSVDAAQAAQERFEREQASKTQEAAANAAIARLNVERAMAGSAAPARKTWDGPMPNRPVMNGRAVVSAEELADFRRKFGASMTLTDLLNADKGRGPSAAMPAARGVQGANIKPAGPRVRPDEAATLPPVGLRDVPGLIMQGMQQGAQRVPAGRGAGAAFVGAGLPRAAAQAISGAKLLREHPSITPERRQMLKEMEDYINGLNKEREGPPAFGVGGDVTKGLIRSAERSSARLAEKAAAAAAKEAEAKAVAAAKEAEAKAAAQRAGAGRMAAEVTKKTKPLKMSEALGNLNTEGKGQLKVTQSDRTRVGGGNIGGAMFPGLQHVDPTYGDVGAVWGVGKKGTASALINQSTPETYWSTVLGAEDQLKSNPLVFDRLYDTFLRKAKAGKLDNELREKINKRLEPMFGEGADILDPELRRKADTFQERAAVADLLLGKQIGGEQRGGSIIPGSEILKQETEPMLLHPAHGGNVPTFAVGPRIFQLSGDVVTRPDLHPGFPVILTGKDSGMVFEPAPGEIAMRDFAQRMQTQRGRKPGYYEWTMGEQGVGLPSQPITEEYLTYLQKLGYARGGAVGALSAVDRLAAVNE